MYEKVARWKQHRVVKDSVGEMVFGSVWVCEREGALLGKRVCVRVFVACSVWVRGGGCLGWVEAWRGGGAEACMFVWVVVVEFLWNCVL